MRYIIILLLLISCGPVAKLKRAERLIKKAEEMGAVWHTDTIVQEIKVPVPEIVVQEIHHAPLHDTVRIEKEKLKIKVVRIPGDSIFVEGKCIADTIIKKVPVTITKTIKATGGLRWWWLIVAAAVGMLLGAIIKLIK